MKASTPENEQQLLARVDAISGLTLRELAQRYHFPLTQDLQHNKGWTGQLLEHVLGTDAGNHSTPDFVKLGIELKTIPLKENQQPAETTYVCMVPLMSHTALQWHASCVWQKLRHVLWVPIESHTKIDLLQRKIGQGFLWQPDPSTEQILRDDWEELMEYVAFGNLNQLDARVGEYLQIRPKGLDGKVRTQGVNAQGRVVPVMPRGFYLRTAFTRQIINQYCH